MGEGGDLQLAVNRGWAEQRLPHNREVRLSELAQPLAVGFGKLIRGSHQLPRNVEEPSAEGLPPFQISQGLSDPLQSLRRRRQLVPSSSIERLLLGVGIDFAAQVPLLRDLLSEKFLVDQRFSAALHGFETILHRKQSGGRDPLLLGSEHLKFSQQTT